MTQDTRIVPHANAYKAVDQTSNYADIALYTTTFLTITLTILNSLNVFKIYIDWITGLNTLIIIIYFVFDTRSSIIFAKAEIQRRLGFIDNSFNTKFDEKRSKDFFTNEDIEPSIYKIAVNNFESCFTTQTVLKVMFNQAKIINTFILLVFISSAIMGEKKYFQTFSRVTRIFQHFY